MGAVQSSEVLEAVSANLDDEALAWLSLARDAGGPGPVRRTSTLNPGRALADNIGMESLVRLAETELRRRRVRSRFLPPELFGEGAWSMLLDLFVSEHHGRKVSTTSACLASDVPATTALRWLDFLENNGFVERSATKRDKRVKYVSLTDQARDALCDLLRWQHTRIG